MAQYVAQAKAKKWRRLCGVVLVSPAVRTPGTYEWGYGKAALTSLSLRGHNHISTSYMLQVRHPGPRCYQGTSRCLQVESILCCGLDVRQ